MTTVRVKTKARTATTNIDLKLLRVSTSIDSLPGSRPLFDCSSICLSHRSHWLLSSNFLIIDAVFLPSSVFLLLPPFLFLLLCLSFLFLHGLGDHGCGSSRGALGGVG